ncbi:MAG: hypothetical protein Q9213_004775 [Squamulea squamosa]
MAHVKYYLKDWESTLKTLMSSSTLDLTHNEGSERGKERENQRKITKKIRIEGTTCLERILVR